MAKGIFIGGVCLFFLGCHLNSKVIGQAATQGDLAFFIKLHEKGRLQKVLERYCGQKWHFSPLRVAIESEQYELLEFFLNNDYGCGTSDEMDRLLDYAIYQENLKAIKIVYTFSGNKLTFEHVEKMLHRNKYNMIGFLEDREIDFQMTDKFGNNLLAGVIQDSQTNMTKKLVELGVDLYQKNNNGIAPIHHALAQKETDLVAYLLEIDANFEFQTDDGRTAKDLANKKRIDQFKRVFERYGKSW